MKKMSKRLGVVLLAAIIGTCYAIMAGMISSQLYGVMIALRTRPVMRHWQYQVGEGKQIRFVYAQNPKDYDRPSAFNSRELISHRLTKGTVVRYHGARESARVDLIHSANKRSNGQAG